MSGPATPCVPVPETAHPHLMPIAGSAAAFGARLRAALPVIETGRCILRAPLLEDAAHWNAILENDVEGHLGGSADADAAFGEFGFYVGQWLLRGIGLWTVTDRADRVLGFITLGLEPGDREPELGFLFVEAARGQGYAFEAATAARRHAIEVLGLSSLVSYIAPGNAASRRLAERLGARFEGTITDRDDADATEVWRHAPGVAP